MKKQYIKNNNIRVLYNIVEVKDSMVSFYSEEAGITLGKEWQYGF